MEALIINEKVTGFHCINPTNKWIVVVNDFRMMFETEKEANKVYDLIDDICASPFGSIVIVEPNIRHENIFGEKATQSILELQEVNCDYIQKRIMRSNEKSYLDFHNDPINSKYQKKSYTRRCELSCNDLVLEQLFIF